MTLLELLDACIPADPDEAHDLNAMKRWARTLAEPFSRSQWPAHFTGSAVVTNPEGTHVVLVQHAKLNRWLQPGGHAEPADGGDLGATAFREATEETGLVVDWVSRAPCDVDVHTIPARQHEPEHEHLDVRFVFRAKPPGALRHDPAESHGAEWVTWADALARVDEAPLRRLLTKAQALVQQSR